MTRWWTAAIIVAAVAGCAGGSSVKGPLPVGKARGRFEAVTMSSGTFDVVCGQTETGDPIASGRWSVDLTAATVGIASNPQDLSRGHVNETAFSALDPKRLLDGDWVVTVSASSVSVSNGPTDLDCQVS